MSCPQDGQPGTSSTTRLDSPAHSHQEYWPPSARHRKELLAMHYARVDHVVQIGGDPYWLYYSCTERDCPSWIWCRKVPLGQMYCTKCRTPWIKSLMASYVRLAVPADPRRATVPLGPNGLPLSWMKRADQ